jgi:hypothetical protein
MPDLVGDLRRRRIEVRNEIQHDMDRLCAATTTEDIERWQESLRYALMDADALGVSPAWLAPFTRYV